MKKIIVTITLLLIYLPANAMISRLKNGVTYCVGEHGGNLIIDWKKNTITFVLGGFPDLIFKIVKEANSNNSDIVITARNYVSDSEYNEFKIFSTPSGDYFRGWDHHTKEYNYKSAHLLCWGES